MPNWKKVITSGSDATLNSLTVTSGVTGSLFGTSSYAITASYAANGGVTQIIAGTNVTISPLNGLGAVTINASGTGGSTDTGSLLVTASVSLNTITFTKGDTSQFSITVATGSVTPAAFPYTGSAEISGSLTVTGLVTATLGFTGSLFGTSSWAQNAMTASYVLSSVSSSFAQTASYFGGTVVSALTASYVNPLNQNVIITGSLTISGSATGSIFTVSASYIDFDFDSFLFSGSSVFQSSLNATQAVSTFGTASITFGTITGSLFGTASWAVSSSRAVSALSASFASTASFVNPLIQTVFITGSTLLTGSLTLTGREILTGSFTVSNSESIQLINQRLVHPATTGSKIFQTSILTTFVNVSPNQTSTALRLNPTFTGPFSGSNTQNLIADFGANNVGSQFTVNDVTSGSIYMVNDVSGLPIIEATSNWDVNIYDYPNTILKKTGSLIHVSGSLKTQFGISGSNAQTTSSIVVTVPSGSSTQDYNVGITKFKSFSYLTTTRPIYQDNYIRLGYDTSGTDPELTILTDPTSGRVQCHVFSTTATTVSQTSDINVASGIVDIYTNGIGSDMRLDITISAGADANYPFYRIVMFRSNTTYGGNITVLIERFFPNL